LIELRHYAEALSASLSDALRMTSLYLAVTSKKTTY